MSKKTLEVKVQMLILGALFFAFFVFGLGAFLLSDGPIFDPQKTYNLMVDTLTLTAYFLAPTTAIVLFSDWREQHVEKLLEEESSEIYDKICQLLNAFQQYLFDVQDVDSLNKNSIGSTEDSSFTSLLDQVDAIKMKTLHLSKRSYKAEQFTSTATIILNGLTQVIMEVSIMGGFKEKLSNPKKYNYEYTDETDDEFIERMQLNYDGMYEQITNDLPNLFTKKKDLFQLVSDLKIKK